MGKKINYKELEKHLNNVFQKLMEEDDLRELVKPVLNKNNKNGK
tara:strand:+ start:334 stop:465 length:132 start_codon:yes stop_codon:yes gene_type:complete